MYKSLLTKIKEALVSVLPITLIVLAISFTPLVTLTPKELIVFGISALLMILVPVEIKDAVLTAVYQAASTLETRSIAFSLPVNKTLGLE